MDPELRESEPSAQRPSSRDVRARLEAGAERYVNRELSWLRFNTRVLEEALDPSSPLLERVKFLSIYSGNLDEFFMIRVSGLRDQLAAGVVEAPPDGMSPKEQLSAIRTYLLPELRRVRDCWQAELRPALRAAGIRVLDYTELDAGEKRRLRAYFRSEIFPILTPLAFDQGHPFPHISNLSVNLAVTVRDPANGEAFARVKVPQTIERLARIPTARADRDDLRGLAQPGAGDRFVWLEQVVAANLDLLFPGLEIVSAHAFRVTRDADFEIEEDEASDLLTAMVEVVGQRHFGSVVRLEIDDAMPERMRQILLRNLEVAPYQVYAARGPLGLQGLSEIAALPVPELHDPPLAPVVRSLASAEESMWTRIKRQDVMLYHPYDSFTTVVDFLRAAADDPDVVAIKQTLYRVGPNSPVVEALMRARENGKQVSVLVELKARFDEQNNIVWARALENAGVHVAYGLLGLKTHAKACLVVRREPGGVRSYVHLSTGNYNPITARVYSDIGYFSADRALAADIAHLFNALTGYSKKRDYAKLLVAPGRMREQLLERIDREIRIQHETGDGRIAFKLNSLVDKDCIDALYRASQAGVRVDLQVRGICCLRPGVPGLSENVRVTSLVGRFLEHTRIYFFGNGGDDEVLIGSADLMPRNLDNRVEVLFAVEDPALRAALRDDVLYRHLADTANTRRLLSDGEYTPKRIAVEDPAVVDSHELTIRRGGRWRV
ncbi:MAG TPA: polyphosphate kinase 1 [Thermoanaerobaculia bacterium]|nr:polyphosphate kinase 1 [Thermoanaerobaculia bacterium]